jgi:glycosyltransferase involved in cell wall biosynthesis
VLTILNGIDLEEFNPAKSGRKIREELGIPMNAFVVSIMSRLAPEKGQRAFLRAARSLHREFPEMHFVVIGDAVPEEKPFEMDLRREAEHLNGSASFTGFRKDMPECFAASDAVVLASEAEPCGRVLFEALASGRPLVATNTGGTPEIVNDQESGFLFPPGDDEKLADCLRRLYQDVELRRSMGAKGRSRAESEFSIQGHVRRIEVLYEQVLQEVGK